MKEILVRDFYNVDTISATNNKPWEILRELLVDEVDTTFDFKGILLKEPWKNDEFMGLIRDKRVKVIVHDAEETAQTINMACILGGFGGGKAENVVTVVAKVNTPAENKIINAGKELLNFFSIADGTTADLNLYQRYNQVCNDNTLAYIRYALEEFIKQNKDKKIIIQTKNMDISPGVLEKLIDMTLEFKVNGSDISVESDYKETTDKIALHDHLKRAEKYSAKDRIAEFEKLVPGTVGLMVQYGKSRALDEFGRQSRGDAISCRPAIFNKVEYTMIGGKPKEVKLIFTIFREKEFYTMQHFFMENDGEIPTEIEKKTIKINVSEVGLYDYFLGSKYHFRVPTQLKEEDSIYMYKPNEVKASKCTMPERIKLVLDDWGIDYYKQGLEDGIAITNEIIGIQE